MRDKVSLTLNEYNMLKSTDKVIVALSGGADSVALLSVLNSLKEEINLTIYAAHVNHMIRGQESDKDEKYVTDLCDMLGIRLFVKRVDVPALAQQQKISLELCGRNERYKFFEELSIKYGAKVATAHTASDNVETVLYNLSRGTSVTGLCGIRPVRDYIIRPLILCSREEVERYCVDNMLFYVTDSTNLTDDYTRNNIRHNVVPVLSQLNKDLCNTVSRMCRSMTEIKAFIDNYSEKELKNCKTEHGYSSDKLLSLDSAILTNAIFMIAKDGGADITYRHAELIVQSLSCGGSVDLPDKKRAVCKQGVLRIVDCEHSDVSFECKLKDCEFARFISKEELKNINKNLLNNCINCDIITDDTVVRTRREGDTFTLSHRGVTKTLKKLFNELKIPAEKRDSLLVVANDSTVLWAETVGTSENGRVNEHCNGAFMICRG